MKNLCKWTTLIAIAVITVVLFAGCDNRTPGAPDISIIVESPSIYNEVSGDSIRNSSIIRVQLGGSDAKISDQKVWFIYNKDVGNLYVPAGGIQDGKVFKRTSEIGYVEVTYYAYEDKAGLEEFHVYAQDYANYAEDFNIMVYDIPEIDVTSGSSVVAISDPPETLYVNVQLNTLSENRANQIIDFNLKEAYSGLVLLSDTAVTNDAGSCTIEVIASPYEGEWGIVGTMRQFAFKTDEVEFRHVLPE